MGFRKWMETIKGAWGEGLYPHQMAFLLNIPLRRLIISPEELADRLHLSQNSKVLEIGPGAGYFSVEVAKRIPHGQLALLDIQPEMLEKVKKRMDQAGIRHVVYVQGDAAKLPFSSGHFDVVFLVTVIGEVADKGGCIREIYRVLRPGGLLSITEQASDTEMMSVEELRSLAEHLGFQFAEIFVKPPFPWRGIAKRLGAYTANFYKNKTENPL